MRRLATPLGSRLIMNADSQVANQGASSFIDHCATELARAQQAQVTSDRRFDVEIRLRDNIEDWLARDISDLIDDVHQLCASAGIAVVLLAKGSIGEGEEEPDVVCGRWSNWQREAPYCFFRGMGRPALRLMIVE